MEDINKVVQILRSDVDRIGNEVELLKRRPDVFFRHEWMDGKDVQRALNISQRTLRTLRSSGIIIPSRLDKKLYYKVADIKTLLEENYIRYHLPKKP